jgi:hypothetical protein
MIRFGLPLLLAASLLPGAVHAADLPDPLGLRGFNLGMTLAEVRKLRHPDADQQKSDAEIGLACAGDLIGIAIGLGPPPSDYAGLGVKTCRFYIDNKDGPRELPMNVGGRDAKVALLFAPEKWPAATATRLFRIVVFTDPANFDGLMTVYQSRFGETEIIDLPSDGTLPPSRALEWENKRYQLVLLERSPAKGFPFGLTGVIYTDRSLNEAIEAALKKKTPGADKL